MSIVSHRRSRLRAVTCALAPSAMAAGASCAMAAGGGGGGCGGGGGGSAGGATNGAAPFSERDTQTDLTTCDKGKVWDVRNDKCIAEHGGVPPDTELTEYACALAKAERYQEALEILDMLQNPDTLRALNYFGYATRKLGRTEEGSAAISSPSRSTRTIPKCANISERLT